MKKVITIMIMIMIINACSLNKEKIVVSFDYGNGEVINCSTEDNKINCALISPFKEGYEFIGWYDAKGNKVNIDEKFNKSVTLYALFKDPNGKIEEIKSNGKENNSEINSNQIYTINFDSNGGSGGQSENIEVKYNSKLPSISKEIPIKNGYIFVGWFDNNEYKKGMQYYDEKCQTNKEYNENRNITLYAGWKEITKESEEEQKDEEIKKYLVSFNTNGGSGGQNGNVEATYGLSLPPINKTAPIRNGYTFMGWYDNADYIKGTQYYTKEGVGIKNYDKNKDITLYAGWIANKYKIVFNANGGSGGQNVSINVEYNKEIPPINKTAPIRNGYVFAGWFDNKEYLKGTMYYNENGNKQLNKYTETKDITLYAGWKKEEKIPTYIVSFNANGGSGGQNKSVDVTYGSAMPAISKSVPIRNGYTFMGWYDNAIYTKGTQYYNVDLSSARVYNKKESITLYAGWKPKTYTVTFDCNGGSKPSGTLGTQMVTYGQSYTLPSNVCTRSGYTQNGWKDQNNKLWKTSNTNNWKWAYDYNVTLKADWFNSDTYIIKYDCNGGTNPPKDQIIKTGDIFTPSVNTCVKNGYMFKDWKDPKGGSWALWGGVWKYKNNEYGISNNILTLKAQWIKELPSNDAINPNSKKYIAEYNSPTLKYWIENPIGKYNITHIWVKDAYKQMRVAITSPKNSSSDLPRTPMSGEKIINNEIKSKKYEKKGLVGINASAPVSGSYYSNVEKNWYGTPAIDIFINDGKIIRNSLSEDNDTANIVYGLSKQGSFKYYIPNRMFRAKNETDKKVIKAKNNIIYGYIMQDKIKYTFGFKPLLLYDGKVLAQDNAPNIRQSICQIDKNNFIIITNTLYNNDRSNGFGFKDLANKMKELGCVHGFNFDGGGSTHFFYKKNDSQLKGPGKSYDGRSIVDILYFVEQ